MAIGYILACLSYYSIPGYSASIRILHDNNIEILPRFCYVSHTEFHLYRLYVLFKLGGSIKKEVIKPMNTVKEEAKRLIDKLPDEVTWDDIMAEIYFKQQVEQGLGDVKEGRVFSHEQVKKMVKEWRRSSGRL